MSPKSIYYYQTNDEFCVQSHDLLIGLDALEWRVFSNVENYPFIEYQDPAIFDGDSFVVSTSGITDSPALPIREDLIFVDGRDQTEFNPYYAAHARLYFKTNCNPWDVTNRVRLLPCCSPVALPTWEGSRDIDVSFLTGHLRVGRDDVATWLREYDKDRKIRLKVGPYRTGWLIKPASSAYVKTTRIC